MTSFVSKQSYHVLIVMVDSTISTGWVGLIPPPPPPFPSDYPLRLKRCSFTFFPFTEGRKHDAGMLRMSGFYQDLERHSWAPDGTPLCVHGDPAYPHRVHLQTGFKGARLTPAQERFNQSMSDVRAIVEWSFGKITTYWAFTDFKKNLKIGVSAVGKQYLVRSFMSWHNWSSSSYSASMPEAFFSTCPLFSKSSMISLNRSLQDLSVNLNPLLLVAIKIAGNSSPCCTSVTLLFGIWFYTCDSLSRHNSCCFFQINSFLFLKK